MPFDLRDIANAVAAGLGSLGSASPGASERLWQDTQVFAGRLLGAATQQWLPFYLRGAPCHVRHLRSGVAFPCGASSILLCGVCQEPTCIHHAQVDQFGNGTCYACIAEMIARRRGTAGAGAAAGAAGPHTGPAPETDQERRVREAFEELDLKPKATWEEVQARHRKLAAKHHPDRVRTPAAKSKAAQKSVRVNSAFAELKKHFQEKAA